MKPAASYQSPSMQPPELPPVGDEQCVSPRCHEYNIEGSEWCLEHEKEEAEERRAEIAIDLAQDDGREYPQFYDGTGKW